ncbi:MAG TPA: hypothetical protein VKY90_05055 [Candidatus Dormibacteraeota bacterium]|nr:hypothetical protein [Candidatus Dormibacteraeota bacterium]
MVGLSLGVVEGTGRAPLLWLLVGLLVSFTITRLVTRRIRAGSTRLKDWEIGGVHIHHQVFGILVVLLSGVLEFAYRPPSPWVEVLGGTFGVGMGMTLDEFALWLHLSDVYWSPEGRRSIDAVFVAAAVTALLLVGFTPLSLSGATGLAVLLTIAVVVVNLALSTIVALKGKPVLAVLSLMIPLLALIGATRLAKPASPWARWRYSEGSTKLARAHKRFGPRYQQRWDRLRDLLGGTPSPPSRG